MKRQTTKRTASKASLSNTPTTTTLTHEEVRQRAHQIFLARGGAAGNELDDWLLAEHELKRERAQGNSGAEANPNPPNDL